MLLCSKFHNNLILEKKTSAKKMEALDQTITTPKREKQFSQKINSTPPTPSTKYVPKHMS